jgi:hypothetical protein
MPTVTNTLWIAANVLLDIQTGEKKEVLMFVNHEIEATFFKEADANLYKDFAAKRIPTMTFKVESTNLRGPNLFVIRGVQVQDV